MSPIECASLDRIHRGIVFSSGSFSEEVEAQLDALQARDFPDFKDMTTRQAGMNLDSDLYRRNNFVDRLRRFSELADESSSRSPLIARPNSKSFNQHNYALVVCETLHMAYGSPCIEVAATLTSAVFDEVIDADTVKKWWQRRDVESSQGDTSEKSP